MTLPFPNAVETDSEEWSDVLAELQQRSRHRKARPYHFTAGRNGELLAVDNRTGEVLAAVVYSAYDRTYFLAQEIKP